LLTTTKYWFVPPAKSTKGAVVKLGDVAPITGMVLLYHCNRQGPLTTTWNVPDWPCGTRWLTGGKVIATGVELDGHAFVLITWMPLIGPR